jgi:5'-3' exonuclease
VAYRCAASCEKQGVVVEDSWVCLKRVDELMQRIIAETGASTFKAFLTGSDNFRNDINPEYKANRKDTRRPEWLQQAREHLVLRWEASVEDGQEADDAMGIYQCANQNTVIASIDKDLLMIPGKHYNFVKEEHREVSELEGIRHFYWQLIMGDKTDNIMGFDGLARQTVPKKLEWAMAELSDCLNEAMMFELVRGMYNDDEKMLMNGRCLWIRRQEGEVWQFP